MLMSRQLMCGHSHLNVTYGDAGGGDVHAHLLPVVSGSGKGLHSKVDDLHALTAAHLT